MKCCCWNLPQIRDELYPRKERMRNMIINPHIHCRPYYKVSVLKLFLEFREPLPQRIAYFGHVDSASGFAGIFNI